MAWPRQRGQATVELALLLPILVMGVLAIVQVGLLVRDELGVVRAAREAVRVASVDRDAGHVVATGQRVVPGASVNVKRPSRVGDITEVDVAFRSVTDLPLVGLLFPDPVLHARASMRVER
ncbi:MAG: pilus assembly protein [Actinobacteria bacterium]|nr:pilus assembly protein [Actinomycetota bacterium]